MSEFKHYTVMKKEAVEALECRDGLIYVDGTLGGGGHSELILQKIQPSGHLIAFDIDDDAIHYASNRLKDYKNLTIIKDSYTNIKKVLQELKIDKITGGILLDLGASYHQLTKAERGFSFSKTAPLDMRFNINQEKTAYDVVNSYDEANLVQIFSEYGEERFSKRIAKRIVEERKLKKIETTTDLARLVIDCTPFIKSKIHPATKVFQAIRIEVNEELKNIQKILKNMFDLLADGAIISIISFHSLEDKIVKNEFKQYSQKSHCNKFQTNCTQKTPRLELLNKKPIQASEQEILENPPSRSAKLRIAKYIAQ